MILNYTNFVRRWLRVGLPLLVFLLREIWNSTKEGCMYLRTLVLFKNYWICYIAVLKVGILGQTRPLNGEEEFLFCQALRVLLKNSYMAVMSVRELRWSSLCPVDCFSLFLFLISIGQTSQQISLRVYQFQMVIQLFGWWWID